MSKEDLQGTVPRDKLVTTADTLLDRCKVWPPAGALIYAKSSSSYWPAIVANVPDEGSDKSFIVFFEESFRNFLIDVSQIIPVVINKIELQKNYILDLNKKRKKNWAKGKQGSWDASYELMVSFDSYPLEERMPEIERRFAIYKEEKERKKQQKELDHSKALVLYVPPKQATILKEKLEVPKRTRKSESYSLRPEIPPRKFIEITNSEGSEDALNNSENGSTSSTSNSTTNTSHKTKKKSEQRPKEGEDLRLWVTDRFENMDKNFKFDSSDNIFCSACKEYLSGDTIVSCHDMPFHSHCVSILEEIDETGKIKKTIQCKDCELKRCFVCKTTGVTKPTKCSKCDLRFHRDCLRTTWPQAEIIGSTGCITCPLHYCHTCKYEHRINDIMRNYLVKKAKSYRCIYCLATYHKGGCVPAGSGSSIMMNQYLICPRHNKVDSKKCRKLGCFVCSKKLKEKEKSVECISCPLVYHIGCVGFDDKSGQTIEDFCSKFKCEACVWGFFPLYGQVVWYQQPGSVYWPGLILYPKDNKSRDNNRTERGSFSISYCGTKQQFYDNCLISRSVPLKIGSIDFLTQLNLCSDKPQTTSAYEESAIQIRLSDKYRNEKLEKAEPIYRKLDKNLYRIKSKTEATTSLIKKKTGTRHDEWCHCGKSTEPTVCGVGSGCYNRFTAMECDDNNCTGGERCMNRMFSKKGEIETYLEAFIPTARKGWGLRCKKKIMKDEFIIEYIGEIVSTEEKCIRVGLHLEEDPLYLLEIDANYYIDAEFYGNLARLMNHSCMPNCIPEKYCSASGKSVVGIFAKRDIDPFEELTFNYNYDAVKTNFHCRCGTKDCKGFIDKPKGDEENRSPRKRLIVQEDWSDWDEECAICLTGGELLMCEYGGCSKVYHLRCIGLRKNPVGDYHCPLHKAKENSPAKRGKIQIAKVSKVKVTSSIEMICETSSSSTLQVEVAEVPEGESLKNSPTTTVNAKNRSRVVRVPSKVKKITNRKRKALSSSPARKPLSDTNPSNVTVTTMVVWTPLEVSPTVENDSGDFIADKQESIPKADVDIDSSVKSQDTLQPTISDTQLKAVPVQTRRMSLNVETESKLASSQGPGQPSCNNDTPLPDKEPTYIAGNIQLKRVKKSVVRRYSALSREKKAEVLPLEEEKRAEDVPSKEETTETVPIVQNKRKRGRPRKSLASRFSKVPKRSTVVVKEEPVSPISKTTQEEPVISRRLSKRLSGLYANL